MSLIIGQDLFFIVVLLSLALPLGIYIFHVMAGTAGFWTRLGRPLENLIYRAMGVDPTADMTARRYAWSVISFSLVGLVALFALQLAQGHLPGNPQGLGPPIRANFVDRLVELLPGVEIHLIADDSPPRPTSRQKPRPTRSPQDWGLSLSGLDAVKTLAVLVAATLLSYGLKSLYGLGSLDIGDQDIIMVYILSVLVVSRVTQGYVYGVVASVASVLAFNFFFTTPVLTFSAIGPDYPLSFLIMLLIALITSALTVRLRTQAKLAVKRERRTAVLYEISQELLVTQGTDNIVRLATDYIVRLFGRSVVFYTDFAAPPHLARAPDEHPDFLVGDDERAVAHWAFVNRKQAGDGTDTLAGAGALYLPVVSRDKALGVIGVSCERTRPSTFSRFFLQTIIAQVALALERQALSDGQRREGAPKSAPVTAD